MAGVLPPLYEPWVEEVVGGPLPVESRATCSSCAMLPRGGVDDPDEPFDPSTKCCTYTPFLPSFLAGAVLAEGGRGAALLEARLEKRAGVTPLGISPTPEARELYRTTIETHAPAFGRKAELRCPYYASETGHCGVWRHRNGICSTWFCRHDRGMRGRRFWKLVNGLLGLTERGLVLHCLERLGLDAAACEAIYVHEATPGQATPEVHMALWGAHLGAERDFFIACAGVVAGMTWAQVVAVAGAPLVHLARTLRDSYQELAEETLPGEVERSPAVLYRIGRRPSHVRVAATAAPLDFIEIPSGAIGALPRLEGRPLGEALEELAAEGVALDGQTVRRLVDFAVLRPVAARPRRSGA